MQFGLFTIGDVTTDPTNGTTPTEGERIHAMTQIALKAEEVGLDVFATGEHHNPPFVPSSPTTHLAYIAAQTKNLLLSTGAEIDTKPELEIYADDVKCAHGATIGQLDDESLFYLVTRGIARREAKVLLTMAFINELVRQIPVEQVRDSANERLNRFFTKTFEEA